MSKKTEQPTFEQLESEHEKLCAEIRLKAAGAPSVEVPLAVPITFEGEERTSLKLRRPTAGDLIEADRHKLSDQEKVVFLIRRVAQIPPEAVAMIDLADFDLVESAFQGFRGVRLRRPA